MFLLFLTGVIAIFMVFGCEDFIYVPCLHLLIVIVGVFVSYCFSPVFARIERWGMQFGKKQTDLKLRISSEAVGRGWRNHGVAKVSWNEAFLSKKRNNAGLIQDSLISVGLSHNGYWWKSGPWPLFSFSGILQIHSFMKRAGCQP